MRKISALVALALLLTAVAGCSKTEKPSDTTAVQKTTFPASTSPESSTPKPSASEEPMFLGVTTDSNGNKIYHHISGTGEILLKTTTKDTLCLNGLAVGTSSENGLVGYKDQNGDYVIEPQFQAAGLFSDNGLAPVQMNEKWGFVNKQGEIVIPCEYGTVTRFNNSGYAIVYTEGPGSTTGLAGIIDSTGRFCLPLGEYYQIQLANEYFMITQITLTDVYDAVDDVYVQYPKTTGYEIRNYDNQIVAEFDAEEISPVCLNGNVYYCDDWHIVYQFIDGRFINVENVLNYTIEDTGTETIRHNIYRIIYNGTNLSDYQYAEVLLWPPFLITWRYLDNNANGCADVIDLRTGEMTAEGITYLWEDDYEPSVYYPSGYFLFRKEKGTNIYGVFDYTGKTIIDSVYDEIYAYDIPDAQFPW